MSITNTNIMQQLQSIIDQLQEDAAPEEKTGPTSAPAARNLDDPTQLREFLTDRISQTVIDIDEENIEHGHVQDDADLYQVQFADLLTLAYNVHGIIHLAGIPDVPIAGIIISVLATFREHENYKRRVWAVPVRDLHKVADESAAMLAELITMEQGEES